MILLTVIEMKKQVSSFLRPHQVLKMRQRLLNPSREHAEEGQCLSGDGGLFQFKYYLEGGRTKSSFLILFVSLSRKERILVMEFGFGFKICSNLSQSLPYKIPEYANPKYASLA